MTLVSFLDEHIALSATNKNIQLTEIESVIIADDVVANTRFIFEWIIGRLGNASIDSYMNELKRSHVKISKLLDELRSESINNSARRESLYEYLAFHNFYENYLIYDQKNKCETEDFDENKLNINMKDTAHFFKEIYKKYMPEIMNNDSIVSELEKMGYFTAPSSSEHHGAWIGGNFEHSLAVTYYLLEYSRKAKVKWVRDDSPYIIGMLHDLCKCNKRSFCAESGKLGICTNKQTDTRHSEKSLELISKQLNLKLTQEEKYCILYHMGKSDNHVDNETMQHLALGIPSILWTQLADTQAALCDKI